MKAPAYAVLCLSALASCCCRTPCWGLGVALLAKDRASASVAATPIYQVPATFLLFPTALWLARRNA